MTSRPGQENRMFETVPLSPAQYNARTLIASPASERAAQGPLVELPQELVSQVPGWANE